mmetsp:Transcript_17784/g.41794  ORF Transcript_17784/g.41794 Transcript_17784/m.41794 type:complete len:253 (-) Transcript_17784:72-830(-)
MCDAIVAACATAENAFADPPPDLLNHQCQWALASHVLKSLPEQSLSQSACGADGVMTAVSRSSQWQLATNFLTSAKHALEPSVATFQRDSSAHNAAISACAKAGKWSLGCGLLEMAEFAGTSRRISYHAAISSLEQGEQWQSAFHMLQHMRFRSFAYDQTGLNAASSAIQRAGGGQWHAALVALMMARRQRLCDIITISTTISACEKVGRWQGATTLLTCLLADGWLPNQITLNAVISACEKGQARHSSGRE